MNDTNDNNQNVGTQDPQQQNANQQPQQPQQPYYGQPQQPYYGQPQQPQQPYYGQPQQPYYGQQQPQQPYYGQPQQPQQPYYGQPQQPYYQPQPQPQPVVAMPASEGEKDAFFGPASSIFMLIFCIIATINLISGLTSDILSLNIGGIVLVVLDILIVVGLWVTFANAKKRKQKAGGIKLVKVPFVIQFIFSIFTFVGNIVVWILTLNLLSLATGIISFIFSCIYFGSVKKTLNLAIDINNNVSVRGKKAGTFAAIVMIINAAFALIKDIIGYVTLDAILDALPSELEILKSLLGGGGILSLVVAGIAFVAAISGAIVILNFGKKLKQVNGH